MFCSFYPNLLKVRLPIQMSSPEWARWRNMRIFGKTVVAVGALAAMAGCGPMDEAEQVENTDAQAVSDPRSCGSQEFTSEEVAQIEARFEAIRARREMSGEVN